MLGRTRILLLAPFAAVIAVAACGSDSNPSAAPDAGARPDGSAAADGTGTDSPSDTATGDAADAADAQASLTCGELSQAYAAEFQKTIACNPASLINPCTAARESILGCGCVSYVNASSVAKLDAIAATWKLEKCLAGACPAAPCRLATGGSCSAGGMCEDTF